MEAKTLTYEEAVRFAASNFQDEQSRYVAARMIEKTYDRFINDVLLDMRYLRF